MTFARSPRKRIGWTGFLVALLVPIGLLAEDLQTAKPEDVGVSSEKVAELSTFMQTLVDEGKIAGGVTMMARHGKVVHLKAVGMADREAGTPMQTDSIFRIASMTKPITSVAVMMLWEQGKLDLDDPVSKYIPEFKKMRVLSGIPPKTAPVKREITIRHLLTHTSGLAKGQKAINDLYRKHGISTGLLSSDVLLKENVARLAKVPLRFHPGEDWKYGMSTSVLGRVIEVVSETPLDRYIEEHICHPLGMNDTFFYIHPEKVPRLVAAYVRMDGHIHRVVRGEPFDYGKRRISSDTPFRESNKYLSGGAGMCSKPADYMRFSLMLLNGGQLNGTRLLRPETVRVMTTNQVEEPPIPGVVDRFGFGFAVIPNAPHYHKQLREAYSWAGFWGTCFRVSPRGDWAVVSMVQTRSQETLDWYARYDQIAAESIMKQAVCGQ